MSLLLICLSREINKAFCGFFDQSRCQQYQRLFEGDDSCRTQIDHDVEGPVAMSGDLLLVSVCPSNKLSVTEDLHIWIVYP